MAHFSRWLMVGSVVASTFAGPAAEACWLTGCCGGGAPRTTFYAPVAMPAPVCPNPCNTCAPVNPCATGACTPTFAQPTTALMPVTAYRPMFGGLFAGSATQPIATTLPYTAGYAPASPYTVGYAPLATPAWTTAPYTSYRPVVQTAYAVPASYSAPVTVQYAPQPVAQAAYYAPAATALPTTTYMPTTTVTPAPVTTAAPGCNCHSSTSTGASGQYWTPNSNNAVVSAAPVTSGTIITSGTTTNGSAVMTGGSNTTFGTTNLGSQGVIQSAPKPVPATPDNNVKPIEDPLLKKSSNSMPSDETDPRNKTALVPLFNNTQVVETKNDTAPIVRSLNELAPYNPVRMTSHVR
jgi:hypothetical protein